MLWFSSMLTSMEAQPLFTGFQVYSKKALFTIKIYISTTEHHRSPIMLRITGICPYIGLYMVVLGWYGAIYHAFLGYGWVWLGMATFRSVSHYIVCSLYSYACSLYIVCSSSLSSASLSSCFRRLSPAPDFFIYR